ncbi:similar to An09g00200 [Aspergillus luchuensis]|uniref:Similar to An09g00200 n=1 Tax=Aspergillus kawachii TaxID=1069201 RepID=A0A146F494_ASPKA|nr:similar to An09g00200 [Aspergillus luchuensis]
MPPITRAQAKHKFPDFLPEASRDASSFALRNKFINLAEYQSFTEILAIWASE